MTDLVNTRPTEPQDLAAKYREESGTYFLTGVQALVRAPIDQLRADRARGWNTAAFISGYQGSPLGGFDRELISNRKVLDPLNVVHKQGVNEELGATAVMGSQVATVFPGQRYDGVLGIWYGKAPGVDRAGDAFRHAQYAGTHPKGGVLALAGDDPSNKSSTLPSSSEYSLSDLHMPIVHPGSVQEVLDLALHGIAISRASGLWTALKIVTVTADGSGKIDVGHDRIVPVLPEFEYKGKPFVPKVNQRLGGPAANAMEAEIYEARYDVARLYGVANRLNRVTHDAPNAWLGIIASGHVYHEIMEALRVLGMDTAALRDRGIRLMQLGMLYPFDRATLRNFADGLAEIVVIEEKRGFIEMHLRDALYGMANAPVVIGKKDDQGETLVPGSGALDADTLVAPLRRRLLTRLSADVLTPEAPKTKQRELLTILPARTVYFCSGCPHSTGTKAPEGALVGTGIGCHGLANVINDPVRMGTLMGNTQMGGEGVQWVGVEPFVEADHFFQNLGDGTFAHSGSLSIRQAVAAGSHMTFKVLYNGAVAMTGGQDASGAMTVENMATWAHCEGVTRVIITTDDRSKYRGVNWAGTTEVWDRDRIVEAQEALAKEPGVTLLIHDQQCAAEKRRDRKRGLMVEPKERIVINERVCEGCGDCGVQSNCLSVQPTETEFGRKTQIHQSSCNKDYTCVKGDCPSFMTVIAWSRSGGEAKVTKAGGGARRSPRFDVSELPKPTVLFDGDVTIRMPGIGGTGVVTVSQVLGTAATLDGKYVGGVDQTGLSQKAGPVVSDLHITRTPLDGANKLTEGSADLYLVFDLLVGLSATNLAAVAPDRTIAVVSTAKTPTGAMVRNVNASYPDETTMRADLDRYTRAEHNRYLDTVAVADGLFGESTTANLLQIGVAYQIGALPLSAESIEQAIELNGAAVEANTWAFRWGRMWAINPARVAAASETTADRLSKPSASLSKSIDALGLTGELDRIVRMRAGDLADYQNERYAMRYLDGVKGAAATGQLAYAEAVAKYLYKLMAYKDEYEVARLHLEEAARLAVDQAVGPGAIVKWNLHPPMLRALGMKNKLMLGRWFTPVLTGLRAGRRLRGTPLDLFGYAKVRRVERELVNEYEATIGRLNKVVSDTNAAAATQLASLPDMVRGYEQIKLDNVDRYRTEVARVVSTLGL